jgi:hypothetical protein
LFGKTFIHGDEYAAAPGHRVKKGPVVEICPTQFRCRVNLVIREFIG